MRYMKSNLKIERDRPAEQAAGKPAKPAAKPTAKPVKRNKGVATSATETVQRADSGNQLKLAALVQEVRGKHADEFKDADDKELEGFLRHAFQMMSAMLDKQGEGDLTLRRFGVFSTSDSATAADGNGRRIVFRPDSPKGRVQNKAGKLRRQSRKLHAGKGAKASKPG